MLPAETTAVHDGQILIVEDSLLQARHLQSVLEQDGYQVIHARDGRQAIEMMAAYRPRLVVSDITMPGLDGYAMCHALKQDPAHRDVPVILLSILADPTDIVRGLEAGADYYLTKPYSPRHLLATVKAILEHPSPPAGDHVDVERRAAVEVTLAGTSHLLKASRLRLFNLLLSVYSSAVEQNRELRLTQEKLETSRANYRALLESNADAMVVVDRFGHVRYLNPAAKALFSSVDEQFLTDLLKYSPAAGETIEVDLVPQESGSRDGGSGEPGDGAAVGSAWSSGSAPAPEPVTVELRLVETQWEGEPATLASLRDVTRRKQLEQRIAGLQAKLWQIDGSAES